MTIAHTRFYKSRVGEFFCFPIGAPEMGVVKHATLAYIIFEGPAEDRNMNTLVDMISGMEVKEDDEDFMNAVDYMFAGLEKRKPDCFAVKQYKKYKLASGDICSK